MKYTIFYFSGTGNTKMITRNLKKDIEQNGYNVNLYSIEDLDEYSSIALKDTVIGIGFPVYKFTYPRILSKVFPLLRKAVEETSDTKLPFFVYSTYCRFAANSLHLMAKDVEKLGYSLIAKKSFKSPSNGIASMKNPDGYEYRTVMYFENRINLSVNEFSKVIESNAVKFYKYGYTEKHHGSPLDKLRIHIVGKIEKSRYPKLQIDYSACIKCGVCVKGCPDDNLVMDRDVVIKDDRNCLHCLRCMHGCPKHAVTFGKLTKGPLRYSKDIREKLYEKAINTPINSPTPDNKWIRIKWTLNNIKYWLLKKN
jgi:ferredoxin